MTKIIQIQCGVGFDQFTVRHVTLVYDEPSIPQADNERFNHKGGEVMLSSRRKFNRKHKKRSSKHGKRKTNYSDFR